MRLTRNTTIHWIELHGEAHIIEPNQYHDRTLCGKTLEDAFVIAPGTEIDGCIACVCAQAERSKADERPPRPQEDRGWQRER